MFRSWLTTAWRYSLNSRLYTLLNLSGLAAGAAVSLPLPWADLKLPERPIFQVASFDQWRSRLARDPWKQLSETRETLTPETLALFKITPTK